MPNVMAVQPNIGGALCKSSVIPRRKVWLTPTGRVPCSNATNIGECRTWMQSEVCTLQNSIRGKSPRKMYILCTRPGDGQTLCKVSLASGERRRCSNEAETRNPLKFAGVPQTCQQISAISMPKFTTLRGRVEEVLVFNKFFCNCRYMT